MCKKTLIASAILSACSSAYAADASNLTRPNVAASATSAANAQRQEMRVYIDQHQQTLTGSSLNWGGATIAPADQLVNRVGATEQNINVLTSEKERIDSKIAEMPTPASLCASFGGSWITDEIKTYSTSTSHAPTGKYNIVVAIITGKSAAAGAKVWSLGHTTGANTCEWAYTNSSWPQSHSSCVVADSDNTDSDGNMAWAGTALMPPGWQNPIYLVDSEYYLVNDHRSFYRDDFFDLGWFNAAPSFPSNANGIPNFVEAIEYIPPGSSVVSKKYWVQASRFFHTTDARQIVYTGIDATIKRAAHCKLN